MPSRVVTATVAINEIAAERRNAVHIPTSMTVDLLDGLAGDRWVEIQDTFWTSRSHGAAPIAIGPLSRYRLNVLQGDCVVLNEEDLKGVKCLGSLNVIAEADDLNCHISLGWKTE